MRLRNIPGARDEMAVNPYVVQEERSWKGRFCELFGNTNPIRLEVGMGKGRFLMEMAGQNAGINYLGIEKYSSVLLRALEKQEQMVLPNVRFLRMNAETLPDVFAPGEIDRIYLNFSDPWPKDRHAKRRLTSTEFLARYRMILKKDGIVEFKTDNPLLFDFSLEQAETAGWELLFCTRDLHHDPEALKGNVMTEYEERFSAQGNPIFKMVIRPKN